MYWVNVIGQYLDGAGLKCTAILPILGKKKCKFEYGDLLWPKKESEKMNNFN